MLLPHASFFWHVLFRSRARRHMTHHTRPLSCWLACWPRWPNTLHGCGLWETNHTNQRYLISTIYVASPTFADQTSHPVRLFAAAGQSGLQRAIDFVATRRPSPSLSGIAYMCVCRSFCRSCALLIVLTDRYVAMSAPLLRGSGILDYFNSDASLYQSAVAFSLFANGLC